VMHQVRSGSTTANFLSLRCTGTNNGSCHLSGTKCNNIFVAGGVHNILSQLVANSFCESRHSCFTSLACLSIPLPQSFRHVIMMLISPECNLPLHSCHHHRLVRPDPQLQPSFVKRVAPITESACLLGCLPRQCEA
jgi:hypothetical protein